MSGVLKKLALTAPFALLLFLGAWLWWNRPQRVDMAAYVPADSLVYLEANSLPEIAGGIVSTDAWKALAPVAGINSDFGRLRWVSRLAAWTGFGPADVVVLSRAQVAVAVLNFDAAEQAASLKITPRAALVAETHTGEARVRAAVEKLVGDFARRTYGAPRIERRETDEATFIIWTAPADARRQIVAAIADSVAIIGNDEVVVRACLAAKRGERPTLASDTQLEVMRQRVGAHDALSFGYVSSASAAKLLELAAIAYVGQLSSNSRTQSVAAALLPQIASKILGGGAWSARVQEGAVVDNYFLTLQSGMLPRLRESLVSATDSEPSASELLPADTYQLTRYNYRNPEEAWRGLSAAISSQLDALSAPFVGRFLEESLKPYGIESPRAFLRAAGPEMLTARLDDSGESTVLIVAVRDPEALRAEVRKHLGAGARTTRIGDAEMLASPSEERGAASFVASHLIMGATKNVRRCLAARAEARTLSAFDPFRQAARSAATDIAGAVTFTDDRENARSFISRFVSQRDKIDDEAVEQRLAQLIYAWSETRLVEGGFERKTRSSFGQFGELMTRFAPVGQNSLTSR